MPTALAGTAALLALMAYLGMTWATTDSLSKPFSGERFSNRLPSGRLAREYFDNLRANLTAFRQAGASPSLLDHDVPEWVVTRFSNLEAGRTGVRYSLLSSVVPLFDERVTFNRPGPLYIVRPGGHLQRTRFIPAAGGSLTALRRGGILRIREARLDRSGGESCVMAEGSGAVLEWEPRPHLRGRDWWLRASYRTDPAQPFELQSDPGFGGWAKERSRLPSMGSPGAAILALSEFPNDARQRRGASRHPALRAPVPALA